MWTASNVTEKQAARCTGNYGLDFVLLDWVMFNNLTILPMDIHLLFPLGESQNVFYDGAFSTY